MRFWPVLLFLALIAKAAVAQPLGQADSGSPGDAMVQAYLASETAKISEQFAADAKSLDAWQGKRPEYFEQYLYMLGLSPRPEKTPLEATVTGRVMEDGYVVEKLHYQSVPKLYVTGNLYRPTKIKEGEKLPAVFYVCGHSGRGRNGNKVAYQSHGIWFARHGYVCLVVDTLQLGEIAAFHHGTYNLDRWWWHSRGYTAAGVEAWNGVRGIDYLVSRPEVDPERIAVTGISGGGAATFWIAAADERVKVAVPVSGMADLESYVPNRVINGHCDCMFLYNAHRWPWTRIAGLIAPRPMLFVNSDQDPIFPMDANERITNRLERMYSLYGASEQFDTVVSVGGHAYRQDIRQAAYRFINMHLKGDARPITDSEVDIVSEGREPGTYPIPPEELRVFPTDADLPPDQLNTKIDEHFVPVAKPAPPGPGKFDEWKKSLLANLRRNSFGYFPDEIPAAKTVRSEMKQNWVQTEDGIVIPVWIGEQQRLKGNEMLLVVLGEEEEIGKVDWLDQVARKGQFVAYLQPRGIGPTRWTRKNPPNYVERSHALLGRTVDTGRVWDIIATAKYLRTWPASEGKQLKIHVAGKGPSGILAGYAAALDDDISAVTLVSPPASHMDAKAPQFLNVLRTCDVPDTLGLLAPRRLTILTADKETFSATRAVYRAAGSEAELKLE